MGHSRRFDRITATSGLPLPVNGHSPDRRASLKGATCRLENRATSPVVKLKSLSGNWKVRFALNYGHRQLDLSGPISRLENQSRSRVRA
ncbi:hypothetical protein ACVWZK_000116 [Bradyrhizobium sp. GM0.4]